MPQICFPDWKTTTFRRESVYYIHMFGSCISVAYCDPVATKCTVMARPTFEAASVLRCSSSSAASCSADCLWTSSSEVGCHVPRRTGTVTTVGQDLGLSSCHYLLLSIHHHPAIVACNTKIRMIRRSEPRPDPVWDSGSHFAYIQ